MGISLWLVSSPSSPVAMALQDVISSLSGAYSSPSFPPHVTLASIPACISLPEIVTCLSSEESIEVSFEDIRTGHTFFRSVFIAIQASSLLSRLHRHVHQTLGVQPKTPEFPHLSLYYGDEHKEEIARRLREDGTVQSHGASGIAVCGFGDCLATEIWVANCEGSPEEWAIVKKLALNQAVQESA